jgi:hypothetical protein
MAYLFPAQFSRLSAPVGKKANEQSSATTPTKKLVISESALVNTNPLFAGRT